MAQKGGKSAAEALLEAHGKAFMHMFDDANSEEETSRESEDSDASTSATTLEPSSSRQPHRSSSSNSGDSDDSSSEQSGGAVGPAVRHQDPDRQGPVVVTFEDPGKKRGSIAQDDALRSMRKAFMSHKASKVLDEQNDQGASNGGAAEEEDLGGMSKEEFEKIMWEVERFGATAFDKKELKSWKSQVITRLGGRAERGPRMDVKIGGGIAKKRKERERKELELAFETGMKTRKGSGKHAKRERDRERDRGLQELSGWRDGTLRLSKRDFDKATQGGPPQGKLSFGSLGLGAKGGMKKGKAPGRGKGGKGGKGGKSSKRR